MAAFAVLFHRTGQPGTSDEAHRMRQALRVLGTDRDEVLTDGGFALSWTFDTGYTPQDRFERQPVSLANGCFLMFLGFLYHREELAEKLGVDGKSLTQMPDCELVALAWQKWGFDCRSHLYGPYSFVVCDIANNRMHAMRGLRGQHLYYHQTRDRVILASSTKAIFAFPDISKEIDELKIADFLVLNHEDKARSYFKGIGIAPSNSDLTVTCKQFEVSHRAAIGEVEPIRFRNDDDYVEAASELLARSVASVMRACETPAISLSGGLDSTTLAVGMLDHLKRSSLSPTATLKGYVHIPDPQWDGRIAQGRIGDEGDLVRSLMQDHPSLDVDFVHSERLSFGYDLDEITAYADMPLRGVGNLHWSNDIAQRCRRDSKRVLITGTSGNGTLSLGCADIKLAQWFREGKWGTLFREMRWIRQRTDYNPRWFGLGWLSRFAIPNLPDALYDLFWKLRIVQTPSHQTFSAINPEYSCDVGVENRLRQFSWDDRYRIPRTRRGLMQKLLLQGALNDAGGLVEAFKVHTGVQQRDPLGDRKLIEFCYAIPDDQFYAKGIDRRLIKRLMHGRLPTQILEAPRGEQSADWHLQMSKDLPNIADELQRMGEDPDMARWLDIPRLKAAIENWPDQSPVSQSEWEDMFIARYAIGRSIAVNRFARNVTGRNT